MYRILIVDDEPLTIESIYEILESRLGDDAALFKTDSSRAALDMIRRQRFDIVLTDIRMPEVSGLQLAEALTALWPDTHLIFLTGFDEFDAVYRAIQYRHVSYLLKIEGHEKIADTVIDHLNQISAELHGEALIARARDHLRAARPILQREMIRGILDGIVPEDLNEQLSSLDLPFSSELSVLLVCARCVDHKAPDSGTVTTLHAVFERYLPTIRAHIYLFGAKDGVMVWLIQETPDTADNGLLPYIERMLPSIQEAAAAITDGEPSFAIGQPVPWAQLYDEFSNAKELLFHIKSSRQNLIFSTGGASEANQLSHSLRHAKMSVGRLGAYEPMLRQSDATGFIGKLREILSPIAGVNWDTPHADVIMLHIASFFGAYCAAAEISGNALSWLKTPCQFETAGAALAAYEDAVSHICQFQERALSEWQNDTATRVQQYIDDHIHEDLSLARIADIMHFNAKYLSRLFKQKTGVNLSDYVNDNKIRKATELLANERLKILDVSRMVGFMSAPYFTRFFKRYMGTSPQAYRESLRKK